MIPPNRASSPKRDVSEMPRLYACLKKKRKETPDVVKHFGQFIRCVVEYARCEHGHKYTGILED